MNIKTKIALVYGTRTAGYAMHDTKSNLHLDQTKMA